MCGGVRENQREIAVSPTANPSSRPPLSPRAWDLLSVQICQPFCLWLADPPSDRVIKPGLRTSGFDYCPHAKRGNLPTRRLPQHHHPPPLAALSQKHTFAVFFITLSLHYPLSLFTLSNVLLLWMAPHTVPSSLSSSLSVSLSLCLFIYFPFFCDLFFLSRFSLSLSSSFTVLLFLYLFLSLFLSLSVISDAALSLFSLFKLLLLSFSFFFSLSLSLTDSLFLSQSFSLLFLFSLSPICSFFGLHRKRCLPLSLFLFLFLSFSFSFFLYLSPFLSLSFSFFPFLFLFSLSSFICL